MRTDFIDDDTISALLWCLTLENRLCCVLALNTGWRISDCLSITRQQVERALKMQRPTITITEQKTGKRSKRAISKDLCRQLYKIAGAYYVFESRDSADKPRTRQAVYKNLKESAKALRISGTVAPHSLRKNYAVYLREKEGKSLKEIQQIMNHYNEDTTYIYALADHIKTAQKKRTQR